MAVALAVTPACLLCLACLQVNAARVADYIASQRGSGSQFLVVSHKPQVYERAGCLVGVYSLHRASAAVTLHMAEEAEGATVGG
jgi:chromosome segregation ATPase